MTDGALAAQADDLDAALTEAWARWNLGDRATIEGFAAEVRMMAERSGVNLDGEEARRLWALAAMVAFPREDTRLLFWASGAGKIPGLTAEDTGEG
jgi:hypothetical protein